MVKEMVMLKKKEGISREDFVCKYEGELVPLILKLCPSIKKYARNYVRTPLTAPDPNALPFDCISEVWYEDMEAFKAFAQLAISEKGRSSSIWRGLSWTRARRWQCWSKR